MAEYIFSNDLHIFLPKEKTPYFGYSDGDTAENYLLDSIKKTKDLSLRGRALSRYIIDWPSMYHFSELRANLLRPFEPFIKKRDVYKRQGYTFLDKELQKVVRDAKLGRRWTDSLVRVSYGRMCNSLRRKNGCVM